MRDSRHGKKQEYRKAFKTWFGRSKDDAALALEQRGFNVAVFERDDHFSQRKQGYGLTLVYNESGPLAELGLLKLCAKEDTPSRSHYVFDSGGSILGYFGNSFPLPQVALPQRGNLRIPRQALRKMLLDRLHAGTVRWGHRLMGYEEHPDAAGVSLTFENGSVEQAALLVGADGVNSLIRTHKTLDPLKYLGVMIILGLAPYRHALLDERGFYTLDGTHRLFTMPFSKGTESEPPTIMWQLSFTGLDEQQARQLAAQGSAGLVQEVLERVRALGE
ncbi:hypothetical protein CYMTET_51059 [Cymbomonas tetramitiformis]|uniref:FAD-binding domain-containing protein n=1 Tax=Cymbomonas tetramitiformis TaxID=36881 RepID=A0AAE0BN34_9CHLO|nr:hypothetical protein CYMTET_51059 [Cymbomonas tetramitiformis]